MEAGIAITLFVDELKQRPPTAERAQLADALVAEMHFTESTIDVALSLIETLVLVMDATRPAASSPPGCTTDR